MQIPKDEIAIIPGGSEKGQKRRAALYRILTDKTSHPDRAPNAHSSDELDNNDCAQMDTGLCAIEHPTVRVQAPDCAQYAHLTVIEQSIEQKGEQSASPSASLTALFVAGIQKTEELPPAPPPKPTQTKEELIEQLKKDFGATVDVQEAAAIYEEYLTETNPKQNWKNGRFVAIVTQLHRKSEHRKMRKGTLNRLQVTDPVLQ